MKLNRIKIRDIVFTLLCLFFLSFNGVSQPPGELEVISLIKSTPLKDQQASGTSWSFATTSFLETENALLLKTVSVMMHKNALPATVQTKITKNTNSVEFINKHPVIDGRLDSSLNYLKKSTFNHFYRFDNPVTDSIGVIYRMAYTSTHFYLYIESKADSITYRDRGFINGDGFKLLFAKPQKDSLTDEYYDIVFSASKDKNYWARKRIWEYNHKQNTGKKLSEETLFEETYYDGKCGFEVLLAWKDIEPYHPFFLESIGYNLYFAKAILNDGANGYAAVADEGIWDEELPKRNFLPVDFDKPTEVEQLLISASLQKRNLTLGESLIIETAGISDFSSFLDISIIIKDDASKIVLNKDFSISVRCKFQNDIFAVELGNLSAGVYHAIIHTANDTLTSNDFVLFPSIDFGFIESSILDKKQVSEIGIIHTLMYKFGAFQKSLTSLNVLLAQV